MQILLMRSKYFAPKILASIQITITAQNMRMVWYWFGTKSFLQSVMADNTTRSGPISYLVIHDAIGAYFLVESMADQ